jgi:hypothetical protein
MSDEKKHDDAKTDSEAQLSDEQLDDASGGDGFKGGHYTMTWDNVKNVPLENQVEADIEEDTRTPEPTRDD